MIVRVKKIRQVGSFRNFTGGGSVAFADGKNMTTIFGFNTLGKSTFTTILKSVGCDDPKLVTERLSIPSDGTLSQEIDISYDDGSGRESSITFECGAWKNNTLKDNIYVFDQDFVHKNVISGASITRENREGFTEFILGAQGVILTGKIEADKKLLRDQKAKLPTFRPTFVKNALTDEGIDRFIALKVAETTPQLEKDKEFQEKRLHTLNRISDYQRLTTPLIDVDSPELDISELNSTLSILLAKDYKSVSDEAWQTLQEHIDANCENLNSVDWLKTGAEMIKSNQCPFCAQELSGATSLIGTYQSIFDAKFTEHEENVLKNIIQLRRDIQQISIKSYQSPIKRFIDDTKKYNPFIPELQEEIDNLEAYYDEITDLDDIYREKLNNWADDARELLNAKEKQTYKSLTNSTSVKTALGEARRIVGIQLKLNSSVSNVIKYINTTTKRVSKLTNEQVSSEISRLEKNIKEIDQKLARINQNAECAIYLAEKKNVNALQLEIAKLTGQLETEQSVYLDKYFSRLDYWFKHLGSIGYKIEKYTNNLGDRKVYSLQLTYNGKRISLEDITKVFSESDMRNLALSVFMSRIEELPNKNKCIIVLDDPVVSFDDNRINATCRELKKICPDFRQIIITTHYKSLIKEFVDCNMPTRYVQLEVSSDSTIMQDYDTSSISLSVHEQMCERLCLFIDGANDYEVANHLRPFMEEHLHVRFQKQIKDNSLENMALGELIDELNKLKIIGDKAKISIHGFREDFNPEHHRIFDSTNVIQARIDCKQLMDLLYGGLSI